MSTVKSQRSHRETIMAYLDNAETAVLSNAEIARRVSEEVGEPVHEGAVRRARKAREAEPARTVELVPLDLIDLDARTQMRPGHDERAVAAYAEVLDDLQPIELVRNPETGRYWIGHGHHRHLAHVAEGAESIRAFVTDGTIETAIDIAIRANLDQVPRCEITKANSVRAFLALHPNESVNAAAKAAHVSWEFANAIYGGYASVTEARKARPPKPAPVDRGSTRDDDEDDEPDEDEDDEPWAAPSHRENPPATDGHVANGQAAELPVFSEEDEFLESCHLTSKLSGDQLECFKIDAMRYYRTRETRKTFADQFRHNDPKAAPGKPTGIYGHRMRSALEINHPKDWKLCIDCHGNGCESCKQRGYHVS